MRNDKNAHYIHALLKAATRQQIKAAGGLESAAAVCRVGRTELSNYQSDHVSRFMPVDVLAQIMTSTRSTELLEALAAIIGHGLVPPEKLATDLSGDIAALAEHAAVLFGHFARECGKPNHSEETLMQLDEDLASIIRIAMHARSMIRGRIAEQANG